MIKISDRYNVPVRRAAWQNVAAGLCRSVHSPDTEQAKLGVVPKDFVIPITIEIAKAPYLPVGTKLSERLRRQNSGALHHPESESPGRCILPEYAHRVCCGIHQGGGSAAAGM